jgi:predicted nucleic acid-binding protein
LKQDFKIIPVDTQIAETSAEIRQKYKLSMWESMITATALSQSAICFSDDPILAKSRKQKQPGLNDLSDFSQKMTL